MPKPFKTTSEEIFAEYLKEYAYDWEYEPQFFGKNKKPDFLIRLNGLEFLFDVKERSPAPMPSGARLYNPIKGIRKKIEEGRNKFKEFGDHLCGLVIYNNGDCNVRLNPWFIFSAMLGDPGFTMRFNEASNTLDAKSIENTFLLRGGKMIRHYSPLELHESTKNISTIVVPGFYRIPNPEFDRIFQEEVGRRQNELARSLDGYERTTVFTEMYPRVPEWLKRVPRVTVCQNPFARVLPDDIFDRPYDERWAIVDGALKRTFAGSEICNHAADPLRCHWEGYDAQGPEIQYLFP